VVCLFMTGNTPDRPHPELTIGCLSKPFSDAALLRALGIASAIAAGASVERRVLPAEFTLY
jgi:hypothetical protein